MAKKDRCFKNVTKISEIKNINGILCAVLGVVAVGALVMGTIEIKQQKRLDELEKDNLPIEQQMEKNREAIKSYFSKYLKSDQYKKDFKEKTGISDALYAALEQSNLIPQLSNDDMNAILERAQQLLEESPKMASLDSIIYQDLYNELYKRVITNIRNNITEDNTITIMQHKTYDVDKIVAEINKKIDKNTTTPGSNDGINKAYIESIVETTLKNIGISDSDLQEIRNDVAKEIINYLNSEEGKKLYANGKNGKNGTDGKDGKEIQAGVDYYTKADIEKMTEILAKEIKKLIDNGTLKVTGEKGYSVTDIKKKGSFLQVTSERAGSPNEVQSVQLPEIPSIVDIIYEEYNPSNSEWNNPPEIDKYGMITVKYKDMSTGKQRSEQIATKTMSNVIVDSFIKEILEDFNDQPINNELFFDLDSGMVYCRECSAFDRDGKLIEGVVADFDNNGTPDDVTDDRYICKQKPDEHVFDAITIHSLNADMEEILDKMKHIMTQDINVPEYDTNIKDEQTRIVKTLLKQYEEILDCMYSREYYIALRKDSSANIPNVETDIHTVFDYYDKVMRNVNDKNHYGTDEDLSGKITEYSNLDNSVFVGYLIDKGYVIKTPNGLNFAGQDDYTRLDNAFKSKLLERFTEMSIQIYNYDNKILNGEVETNGNPHDETVELENEEYLKTFKMVENIYDIVRNGFVITIDDDTNPQPGSVISYDEEKMTIEYSDEASKEYIMLDALFSDAIHGNSKPTAKFPLKFEYNGNITMDTNYSTEGYDKLNAIHGKLGGIRGVYLEKSVVTAGIAGNNGVKPTYKLIIIKDELVNISGETFRISLL